MKNNQLGQYIQQIEGYKAFTLFGFPPEKPFEFSAELYKKNEEAMRLGREYRESLRPKITKKRTGKKSMKGPQD